MTKHFSILFLAIVTLLFSACKEDETPTPDNTMEVNGTSFKIARAIYTSGGTNNGKTDYYLYLTTEGFELVNYPESDWKYLEGTGKYIIYRINQVPGDFSTTAFPTGTFTNTGGWGYDVTNDDSSRLFSDDVFSNNVAITKSGSTYTLNFTAVAEDGPDKLVVKYTGPITYEMID